VIRRYIRGEEEALRQLFYETVHGINIRDYSQAQVDAWAPADYDLEAWIERLEKTSPWVACEGDDLLGFAEMDSTGRIDCFYVHHARQGRQIGSALLDKMQKEAMKLGLLQLEVEASISARDFFQHKGFVTIQRQQVERRGELLTNYLMRQSIG
jgi:ribosomal protein S18 acetylase RimI-like enzyme